MIYILFSTTLILAVYFRVRLYILKRALRETRGQLQEIMKDLTQNQILHLPFPNRDLGALMDSVNKVLDEIRGERRDYRKRERQFQSQIEAVSHDLRTPLTVILGYLKLLQEQEPHPPLPEGLKETLEIITRKALALEKLISQLYDYSRLTASDYELSFEEIDAGRILREVFVDNCLLLENARLEVETDFADYPVFVKGEAETLKRILTNLLQNAARYAVRSCRVAMQEEGNQVRIVFENDADNISPRDIPHLFEPFYMNDRSRRQGGSGLGLTIAKRLAEEMGGTLEARTDCDSGLKEKIAEDCIPIRFTLTLYK